MNVGVRLRVIGRDEWRVFREVRLAALAEAPYAFGSTLAQWQGDGDTEERWRARLTDVPFNVVAEIDGRSVGLVSGTGLSEDGEVELISLWVAPQARGQGVGDALIVTVVDWARAQGARTVALDVVAENEHAVALYRRNGFVEMGRGHECERRFVRELEPGAASGRENNGRLVERWPSG